MVRRLRFFALLAVLAMVLTACDWPMFRNGPDHTGFSRDTSISKTDVTALVPTWTATTGAAINSSPAVANGVVYIGSGGGLQGGDNRLYAFDAAGTTNCSSTPKTCSPLWTASAGGAFDTAPAVANGVVYIGSFDNKLYAFDAAGSTGCTGTPKSCAPLWTTTTGGVVHSSPAIANGVVYVSAASLDNRLYAIDAAGSTNCSGTPKSCAPLWTATKGDSSPAVANGIVYTGAGDFNFYAFDAAGNTNCSGTPKSCDPLWTAADLSFGGSSPGTSGYN